MNVLSVYYSDIGKNPYTHLIARMLKNENACVIDSGNVSIDNYNNPKTAKLFYPKFILKRIKTCPSDKIILVQLLLSNHSANFHANLLVVLNNNLWRLEPNAGTTWDQFDPVVDNKISIFCNEAGLVYRGPFPGMCPMWLSKVPNWLAGKIPLAQTKPMRYLSHSGLCMFLSVAKFIYGQKLTNSILKTFIISFFKQELKSICA